MLALLRGNEDGWTSTAIIAELVGAAAFMAAFLAVEHRAKEPMLPLGLFRNRAFTGAQVAAFAISASLFLYTTGAAGPAGVGWVPQRKGCAVTRYRAESKTDRQRGRHGSSAPSLFALQSAIGNRASASLLREAATSSSPSASIRRGNKRAYVTIEGTKQGKFKGSALIKGREEAIEISKYRLGAQQTREVVSGKATGKRQYQAISFKKAVDAASPQLMQALATNETLKTVRFQFYGPSIDGGQDRVYQTVTLTNASVHSWVQDFEGDSAGGDDGETVELVFEDIKLESNTGSTSAEDLGAT